MNPAAIIETQSELDALIEVLNHYTQIAIDTESNSFYAYYERVCLIQISTADQDFIIDPFSLHELSPMGEILNNPKIEKIFHAASNDVLGLKRDFGFQIRNLFDTAVACKLLGYTQLGLARLLEEHFGVSLNKKWQRHDWSRRPLSQEQLDYARLDTHYLIPLRQKISVNLNEGHLWDSARESFEKACEQQAQLKIFHPDAFIQIHGARALDATGKRILKALYLYREHEARRRNRAPFRILSNDTLLRLARQRPKNTHDFFKIKGIPRTYHNGHASQNLLELIRKTEGFMEEAHIGN